MGEELTVSYISLCLIRAQRQVRLQNWRFSCTCSICQDTPASHVSERQRAELIGLGTNISILKHAAEEGDSLSLKAVIEFHQSMALIMVSEGLTDGELCLV